MISITSFLHFSIWNSSRIGDFFEFEIFESLGDNISSPGEFVLEFALDNDSCDAASNILKILSKA